MKTLVKQKWQTKRLGETCIIKPPKKEAFEHLGLDDLVSFVPMEDLGILTKDFIATKERTLNEVAGSYTYFSNDDVLLAKITPCFENGKIGIARNLKNGIGFGSSEYIVFRSKGSLLPDYLYYFLIRDEIRKIGAKVMTGAVGHKRVPKEFIENQEIPFPESLDEQQRIVAILDEAFAEIDKAKKNAEVNLKNTRVIFESYLQRVFANSSKKWKLKKLSDTCNTGAGGTPLKSHKDYYQNGTIPWLRSGEVNNRNITESDLYITEKGLKNSSARLFPPNTVLIAMYGATAGQVGILRFESTTNQAVCGILPNEEFLPEYLYYVFKAGKANLVKQAVGGAQPNISQIKIKNTFIPVPSLLEQKHMVDTLDELFDESETLAALYQQKLKTLEELKKSILSKAFRGEL